MRWIIVTAAVLAAAQATAREISPADLQALPPADVVILGEVHDNPLHHDHQAQAVAALAPRALVFEMLTPEQAARATPELRGDPSALQAALGWNASGWPDFAMYYSIFAAAPAAAILGAAIPRDRLRAAVTEGAAKVFGDEAGRYGLDRPLSSEDQAAREDEQMQAHCNALPAEMLPGMVQAQRLRDAALAQAAVQAMEQTGGPVAVITGWGHARTDQGVPAALALAAPGLRVLSVGQLEGRPEGQPSFDLWLVTEPAPREDYCASFQNGG